MECVYSSPCNFLILMRNLIGVIVGDQLYLERFVWFDHEARRERFPNANTLGEHFEIAQKLLSGR